MKNLTITDLIEMYPDNHDFELGNKIKENPEYKKAQKEFYRIIDTLETKIRLKLDDEAVRMETIAKDVAFNEGFKLAIQLILSSLQ